ncbi:MAG TPA: hypothetical protein VHR66_15880 [Gemmataceae bacterium]|jgi:uncharacterized DUF497 family protein|nr:hypothetical protein [Gemmataceae bacterium]
MEDALVDWDDADDPDGNTAHIAEHGLTPEEVESVLRDRNASFGISDSTARPAAFGTTDTGRFIIVVDETLNPIDPMIVRPVAAYEVPEPA